MFHSSKRHFSVIFVIITIYATEITTHAYPLKNLKMEQESNICSTYPLLHLCLLRPMLKGALAEINYLVSSVAFINNGPDGYYLSGEQDQSSTPLKFSFTDARPSFILQSDNTQTSNVIDEESSTQLSTDSTMNSMPNYIMQDKKHKRNLPLTELPPFSLSLLSLSSQSVKALKSPSSTNNLQTRSLFERPSASKRKKVYALKAPLGMDDAHDFIVEWLRNEKRRRIH